MQINRLFKALGDDTRLAIISLLKQQGQMCVCDIYGCLDLSQPKVSRHLAYLREIGLVQDSRRGTWVYYRLHESLPGWAGNIITQAAAAVAETPVFNQYIQRLGSDDCCQDG